MYGGAPCYVIYPLFFASCWLLDEAREMAIKRMDEDARKLGADAIVGLRFMTSQIAQGAAEILVYGTAVKFK